MSALEQLYQQVILDHAREKHGRGLRAAAGLLEGESKRFNPLCGDEVTVRIALDGATVEDLSWVGEGCSISQASTSVLHDLVVGRTVGEAAGLVQAFRAMVRARGAGQPDESLGDAAAFSGVGRHANRVKCAMLGWTAFEDALTRAEAVATTDDPSDV
jgi:nitrogen fixation NifU-like protein